MDLASAVPKCVRRAFGFTNQPTNQMKIEIKSDRDYKSLCLAMENIMGNSAELFQEGWGEASVRKRFAENPFLNAGREAIIHYLDTGFHGRILTNDQLRWLDQQQEYIAVNFYITEGEDY